ncbi:TIGR01777 family oxidoreductase [Nocardioides donggukensis]|uniref:TIGR01777 family protein n=1 Tax=Nocardioides donggukensis TaxID=2774019 RepID=A0A927K4Z5_9ACTN|nr:TIGR01777 family oxidoreductase [Nocardioides donggukensis]MBD8869868.1 TIGR01777 family protein [Nocardioides donggukensis]
MRVVIAGSSGFLGTALRRTLDERGHETVRLVRREAGPGQSRWDPYAGTLDQSVVDSADVVVNLAGSPTAGNPHSKSWARELEESRVTTTRVLAEAVARSHGSGHSPAYLAGNGISWYGDHGDQVLDEGADSRGEAFLTRVSRVWQAATEPAAEAGARLCLLRTAPVLDRRSAPLKQLLPLFRLGLGARLGDGRQFFPIISLRDWVGAVTHLVEGDGEGPHNLCCPITPTNGEFTEALARAVHRRAFLFAPAPVLGVAAGRMSPELLGSVRAEPAALMRAGYDFADDDVRDVLATGLAEAPEDGPGPA